MKKLIYGKTWVGKSVNFIGPILRESNKVLYITENGIANELSVMGVDNDFMLSFSKEYVTGDTYKTYIDLFRVPVLERDDVLMGDIVREIESSGVSNDPDATVIFSGFANAMNDTDFIARITGWSASVIVEFTAFRVDDMENGLELKDIYASDAWEKVIVREPIGER